MFDWDKEEKTKDETKSAFKPRIEKTLKVSYYTRRGLHLAIDLIFCNSDYHDVGSYEKANEAMNTDLMNYKNEIEHKV